MQEGILKMKNGFRPLDCIGFVLASTFAVFQGWSLQEFCWSTWLAGLCYSWVCIITAAIQIILTASSAKPVYQQRFPFLRRFAPAAFQAGISLAVILVAIVGFRLYSYLFGFYGLFLSVFSEMEPHALFGRNGFINSDFFTPVTYLLQLFWPMVLGTLVANGRHLFQQEPWKRIALPFQSEILRIHVMTIAMPFISLLAWYLFGENYHQVTIVVLMALFYLLPGKRDRTIAETRQAVP
jgi:hypothetical protein